MATNGETELAKIIKKLGIEAEKVELSESLKSTNSVTEISESEPDRSDEAPAQVQPQEPSKPLVVDKAVKIEGLRHKRDTGLNKPNTIGGRVMPLTAKGSGKKNAFILFCDSRREALLAEGHTFPNGYASMAAVLDQEWKDLPEDEKQEFKDRAQKWKERHLGTTAKLVQFCDREDPPVHRPSFRPGLP